MDVCVQLAKRHRPGGQRALGYRASKLNCRSFISRIDVQTWLVGKEEGGGISKCEVDNRRGGHCFEHVNTSGSLLLLIVVLAVYC